MQGVLLNPGEDTKKPPLCKNSSKKITMEDSLLSNRRWSESSMKFEEKENGTFSKVISVTSSI